MSSGFELELRTLASRVLEDPCAWGGLARRDDDDWTGQSLSSSGSTLGHGRQAFWYCRQDPIGAGTEPQWEILQTVPGTP